MPASLRIRSHKKTRTVHKVRANASFSEVVGILENALVAEEGLERTPYLPGKTASLEEGDVESDEIDAKMAQFADELKSYFSNAALRRFGDVLATPARRGQ